MGFVAGAQSSSHLDIWPKLRQRWLRMELDAAIVVAAIWHDMGYAVVNFKPRGKQLMVSGESCCFFILEIQLKLISIWFHNSRILRTRRTSFARVDQNQLQLASSLPIHYSRWSFSFCSSCRAWWCSSSQWNTLATFSVWCTCVCCTRCMRSNTNGLTWVGSCTNGWRISNEIGHTLLALDCL